MSLRRVNFKKAKTGCHMEETVWIDYMENELDETLRQDLLLHLNGCSSCQENLKGFEAVRKSFVKREVVREPNFDAIHNKIMQRVQNEVIEAPEFSWRHQWWTVATAACLVLVMGGVVYKNTSPSPERPSYSITADDKLIVENASQDPQVFGDILLSHQESEDLVFDIAAEKLSHMSDKEVGTVFEKMK